MEAFKVLELTSKIILKPFFLRNDYLLSLVINERMTMITILFL